MFFTFDSKSNNIIQLPGMKVILSILLFIGLFFYSCATTEKPEAPAAEETPEIQPAETPAEPVVEQPASDEKTDEEEIYVVSQEVYEQTFEEIQALIMELNQVISKKQYERWLDYLSEAYIKKYNSTETLSAFNEYPQMKDNGIVLKNLKDYFNWVVVPSRSRATLGDIVFVDETKVIAYSSFEGKKATLYQLEKDDGKWKITVWD